MNEQYEQTARAAMENVPTERTWQVPAHHNKGPVTITMQMPEVTITDSDGRHITIAPGQAGTLSSRLDSIHFWYTNEDQDWEES